MKSTLSVCFALGIILIITVSPCFSEEANTISTESNKYLDAVRTFADNVLKYGRDTYGPKHTPLFVDGLNIHTHEPVKWMSPKGNVLTATETEEWILSNFASQQTLLRTLDGLSNITGDPRYREAAIQATKYAFENLRHSNGLFYWGHYVAYDAQTDKVKYPPARWHILKIHYPYYELMWQVSQEDTREFVEAYWSAHVFDWSNLDFNRYAPYSDPIEKPWDHEYKRGPIVFSSKSLGGGFFRTGASLVHAGTTLYNLSRDEDPLIWSKRLMQRFVDTRHPNTGISRYLYNARERRVSLGGSFRKNFTDLRTDIFPLLPFEEMRNMYYPEDVQVHPWISVFLVGDMLGEPGREFSRWAQEELTAWGKASYQREENSFSPILTDGTNIEGYACKEDCPEGPKGSIARSLFANCSYFWAYAVAYRVSGNEFMWQMARDIVAGNNLGDIGETCKSRSAFRMDTTCSDVYALLGFLELYHKTHNSEFLRMARRIADNIIETKFHKGFFVLSKKHIYSRFDSFEPLALLHLAVALESKPGLAPQVWPSSPLFTTLYRHRREGGDRRIIYTLTKSPEVPLSLQEAGSIGDVNEIRWLIEGGTDVDNIDNSYGLTALQRAAFSGHKDAVELLIAEGAQIDYMCSLAPYSPLHYAVRGGHKDVVELLLARGADINLKDELGHGQTPLDIAIGKGHMSIIQLLADKGGKISSIHAAVQAGTQELVKAFLDQRIDANVKDKQGKTALFYAVEKNYKDIVELLLKRGADVNARDEEEQNALFYCLKDNHLDVAKFLIERGIDHETRNKSGVTLLGLAIVKGGRGFVELLLKNGADVNVKDSRGYAPLHYAILMEKVDMAEALVTKGANVHLKTKSGYSPLHLALWDESVDIVKLLVDRGSRFNEKDPYGWTAFYHAVWSGNRELVDIFISKGADISTFHMAAAMGDMAGINAFLEQGFAVDAKDEMENTPLSWAICMGQVEVVKLLLAQGADVNLRIYGRATALHQAARVGNTDIVQLLITQGADVNAENEDGETALDFAQEGDHSKVIKLLREYKTKTSEVESDSGSSSAPIQSADKESQSPDMAAAQVTRHTSQGYMSEYRVSSIEYPDNSTHTAYKATEELFGLRGQKGSSQSVYVCTPAMIASCWA
ncbi:ankyrin repeat domain-containing protein, partial [Planctomycetota bacterium]